MPYVKLEDVLDIIKKFNWNLAGLMQHIKEHCPTADVMEVVRCEDCQWATERTKDNELFQYQCRNTMACGKPRRDIDFCSYGERKVEK